MNKYILYTDKPEKFECSIEVKGATLKNSQARLIVETTDLSLVFPGTIDAGKCYIPIRKLEGILEKNQTGNIRLEVIVDNTFFTPWQSDFIVETDKSVSVKVAEAPLPQMPTVEVSNIKKNKGKKPHSIVVESVSVKHAKEAKTPKFDNPQTQLVYEFLKHGIGKKQIEDNINVIKPICNEFFSKNKAYRAIKVEVIKEAIEILKLEK